MAIFRVPVNIVFPGAGSPGANIWHIRTIALDGPTELSNANGLIALIRTFYADLLAYLPNTTTLSLGTVVEEGTQREIVPTFATVTGTGTGSSPQALALVVTWKTAIAARRGRGRTFFGPLNTGAVESNGTPNETFRSNALTAAQNLVNASMAFNNGAIGVWGYQDAWTSPDPRPADSPRVLRDFTGRSIRDLFGILRSRRD